LREIHQAASGGSFQQPDAAFDAQTATQGFHPSFSVINGNGDGTDFASQTDGFAFP